VAIPKTTDKMTKLHLVETRNDIQKILGNKYSTPGAAAPMSLMDLLMGGANSGKLSPTSCWSQDMLDPDLRKELEAEIAVKAK
jgi:hypothetical protein